MASSIGVAEDRRSSTRTTLRSTFVLSSGWAVSLAIGLLSAKLTATLMGPGGVGYIALLQSLLGLAVLAAAFGGVSAGIVPAVGRARAAGDSRGEAAARAAAWCLWLAFGGMAFIVLLAFREPLARLFLGTSVRAGAIPLLAAALVLSLAATIQVNILASYRRIADISRLGVTNSVLGPAILLPLIWYWGETAVPWAMLFGGLSTVLIARQMVRRYAQAPSVHVAVREITAAAHGLLRFGIPFSASSMAGAGVTLLIPVLILHALGSSEVGFYRAASGVSMTYLGFLASAMGQDFYPRVSACGPDLSTLTRVVNEQIRLVLLLIGPLVLGILAFVPWLVPLIYTAQFAPAISVLEWQLVGDILKIGGWAMAFAILDRSSTVTYFCVELLCAAMLLSSSWIGMRLFQLEGIGMASAATSGVSLLIYAGVARHTIGVRMTRENQLLIGALLLGALAIRAVSHSGSAELRLVVGSIVAAAAAIAAIRTLRAELGGLRNLMPRPAA